MSMNIKSDAAHELARTLASATGETITGAVTVALEERLERVLGGDEAVRARAEALLIIGRDAARHLEGRARALDHGALLYDEEGLPR
jgi:antitoxin VapB